MRLALTLVLALSGCASSVIVGEPCNTGEVACGWRELDPQRIETRCFFTCAGGQWVAQECLPECGPGRALETGANGTACELRPVACALPPKS